MQKKSFSTTSCSTSTKKIKIQYIQKCWPNPSYHDPKKTKLCC